MSFHPPVTGHKPKRHLPSGAGTRLVVPLSPATGRRVLAGIGLLVLGACVAPATTGPDGTGFLKKVPDEVLQLAAPYQNLQEIMLMPEDGCYWYRHVGQVETTMLPLLTREGRPICTRVDERKPPVTG